MNACSRLMMCAAICVMLVGRTAMAKTISRDWTVDGVGRTATVYVPDAPPPAEGWPLVFIFHGHGGSSRQAARSYQLERSWPDAVVVYPQGLPTAGQLTDPQGQRAGWSVDKPAEKNRDVRFFDAMLKSLESDYRIDPKRVFVGGHSNGGSFTYALWAMRADVITAFAPSSAVRADGSLPPKPAILSGGTKDPLVKWAWQERMMQTVRKIDKTGDGKPWGKDATWYDSTSGTPVVTIIYDGGHAPPADLGEQVAKFFKAVGQRGK